MRWVKIEGCEYQLTKEQIRQGLKPFGELLTPIREDICEDSDSERDRVGNGTNSVKMKLFGPIPQFLPMHGRRIRIYHSALPNSAPTATDDTQDDNVTTKNANGLNTSGTLCLTTKASGKSTMGSGGELSIQSSQNTSKTTMPKHQLLCQMSRTHCQDCQPRTVPGPNQTEIQDPIGLNNINNRANLNNSDFPSRTTSHHFLNHQLNLTDNKKCPDCLPPGSP